MSKVNRIPAIPECGICGQPHPCHSPHLKSWCNVCMPPISVAASNVLAHEISRPAAAADRVAAVSDYARREGYVPAPVKLRMPRPA